jgi:hypothetical protein
MSFLSSLQPPSTNIECATALGTTMLCCTRKCFNLEPGFPVCRWTVISSQGATLSSPKVDMLLRFSQISQDGAIIHIQAIFVYSYYPAHAPQANLCDQTDRVIYYIYEDKTSLTSASSDKPEAMYHLNMLAPTTYSNVSNQRE